jgi:hypothetical protein
LLRIAKDRTSSSFDRLSALVRADVVLVRPRPVYDIGRHDELLERHIYAGSGTSRISI